MVFWIRIYASYEFLFYITVISYKSSSLVIVSRWLLWANVIFGQIKLISSTEA